MKSIAFSLILCCVIFHILTVTRSETRYKPTWESIDSRPLPDWYDKAKVGIFLHWGVFSVPAFNSAWFWYYWKEQKSPEYVDFMKKNYPPDFTYADFAAQFHAQSYNPDAWADLFQAAGAKYVVLVTKHHEGFTLWPSDVSWNWNAYDVGPHMDLVGALEQSVRNRTDIHFGVYHSMFEFFNPLYTEDRKNNYTTQTYVRNKAMPELYELVNRYKPDVIWSDGAWSEPYQYWNSTEFLAWLYNDSPVKDTVVTNDRWGKGMDCKHGGFWNCDDRYNPGKILKHKWENAFTLDRNAWTYRRDIQIKDVLTMQELLSTIAKTISTGGNVLINAGPTADGNIIPIFEERLLQLGSWLRLNGEAVYETRPWYTPSENSSSTGQIWYTTRKEGNSSNTIVYGILVDWPEKDFLVLTAPVPTNNTMVSMIGYSEPLKWTVSKSGPIRIDLPIISVKKMPSQWAWVIKFENLQNRNLRPM